MEGSKKRKTKLFTGYIQSNDVEKDKPDIKKLK